MTTCSYAQGHPTCIWGPRKDRNALLGNSKSAQRVSRYSCSAHVGLGYHATLALRGTTLPLAGIRAAPRIPCAGLLTAKLNQLVRCDWGCACISNIMWPRSADFHLAKRATQARVHDHYSQHLSSMQQSG